MRLCSRDGTARIFADDPRVITFSIHGANQSFPIVPQQSDYDVALPDSVEDDEYMRVLRSYIPRLLAEHNPDLVIFQAGVDGLREDSLGRMSLTRAGLSERNSAVYRACLEYEVPCVVTMGGGYARPDIGPSVDAYVAFSALKTKGYGGERIWPGATVPNSQCLCSVTITAQHGGGALLRRRLRGCTVHR